MDSEPFVIRVQPAIKHYGPPEAYKNDSCPRGAVFIANYRNFDKSKNLRLKERTGSEVNVRHLEELFTQMEYEVTKFDDPGTKDDTLAALVHFRQLDIHKNADSLIVIFSSHGKEDELFTSDGQLIHYKSICQMFSDENCPDLIGKPKLFMFQFCRNEQQHSTTPLASSDSPAHKCTRRGVTCTYVCLATAEGQTSYRTSNEGALFLHEVCKIFMENVKDKHFDSLMKLVSENLLKDQAVEIQEWRLTKCFYFNPPLIGQEAITHNSTKVPSVTDLPAEPPELQMDDGVYKMSSNPKGKVLIINNLDGCIDDESKLKDIFHQLGFSTSRPINNVSYDELRTHFEDFKMQKHHDAAIIIIYGRGFEDHVVCSDNKAISYRDMIKMFQGENCSELEGKPKIFIINYCCFDNPSTKQAEQGQSDGSNSRPTECEIMKAKTVSKAADKDTFIYGVEVGGGNCEQGSLLTQALYQVLLAKQNTETELIPLLRQVSDTLEKLSKESTTEYFVVTYNFRFEKNFYFSLQNPNPLVMATVPSATGRHLHPKNRWVIPPVKTPVVGSNLYKNTSFPRGKAVIICFSNYESKLLPKSYELLNEVDKYRQIVEDLGYDVKLLKDCTHESINYSLKSLDGTDAVDSLMIIAFGYAKDVNTLYDVNGQELPVSDIFHVFTDSQCLDMRGKPKLFCFHMTILDNLQEFCLLPPKTDLKDAFAYFLICSLSDNSEGHPRRGLESIYEALERGSSTSTDVETIIRQAEEQLAKHPEKRNSERLLIVPIQFQKEFVFNPTSLTKQ